jgi:hypothetical protein
MKRLLLLFVVAVMVVIPSAFAAPGNFETENGNVHCQYLPKYQGIACGMKHNGFTVFLGVTPGATKPMVLSKGTVFAFPGGGFVLADGTEYTRWGLRCVTVRAGTGIRCDAIVTDHGFVLARGAVKRW